MNKVILSGRPTRDPETRYSQQGDGKMQITRYTLAVDRRQAKNAEGEPTADFFNCVCFGNVAAFAEKYVKKGQKINVFGHLTTGSYTNKDGVKVYTTEVVVEEHDFADGKRESAGANSNAGTNAPNSPAPGAGDGFMNIPDGIDEYLPFN